MYKKKEEESKGGAPEWMNTYGDLVTLVLTFFILLYAMSNIDATKLQQVVESYSNVKISTFTAAGGADGISDLLGSGILETPTNRTPRTSDIAENIVQAAAEMAKMASDFKTYFAENNLEERIEVTVREDSITLSFKDGVLFDSGHADLKTDSLETLNMVAEELFNYPENMIEIVGHTDNLPIDTIKFPSNWWLSSGRAITVGEYFINEKNIAPNRILATGRGEYVPIAPNDTAENRAKNRRVEIIIKSKLFSDIDEF